jgi:hypothetical protein
MSERKLVRVQFRDGVIEERSVEIMPAPCWEFVFSGVALGTRRFSADDLFEAMILLRLELEALGAQLLCGGARTDVFPSRMSRDMGGGRSAYLTRLGSPALPSDLVDIFDTAGVETVGSVQEQATFHNAWLASLRK